jgi:kynurenine--oxoglutarate transaminase/cysteine-S-conjugate beta-lyase/glutamine--phenylpyruvate transaminase
VLLSHFLNIHPNNLKSLLVDDTIGFDAPTVWSEFTPLANAHKAVNLGQGFPDWATPEFAKKALIEAINGNYNQYCRSAGEPALVEAIAKHYGPLVGRTIDALNEVTVGVGASEVLFAIMQSMLNDGDEVVTLEPTFDM